MYLPEGENSLVKNVILKIILFLNGENSLLIAFNLNAVCDITNRLLLNAFEYIIFFLT